jgi:hypothetical protein
MVFLFSTFWSLFVLLKKTLLKKRWRGVSLGIAKNIADLRPHCLENNGKKKSLRIMGRARF